MNRNIWKYFHPKFEYEDEFPDVDEISAWVGHKYFAYDFVHNIKPKVIVELGTHYGASFFSMCQAVKDGNLNTSLYAVDTWKGDKQSGFYDQSVFIEVNKIKNKFYPKLKINLLKKTFDEAVNDFKNNSIDILHIDGLHTYKAVKHDFDNWFNKITKDGAIVLHDTYEKKDDFGVYKLWAEIKTKFKTLEFSHSHGLGILFKNPKPYQKIFNFQEVWQHYYPIIFENRNLKKEVNIINSQNTQLSQQLSQKSQETESYKNQLQETQAQFQQTQNQLNQTLSLVETVKKEIEEKNKKIKDLENKLKVIRLKEKEEKRRLTEENQNLQNQIEQTKTNIQNLENTLNKIKSAKFFKLWQEYNRVLKFLKLKS